MPALPYASSSRTTSSSCGVRPSRMVGVLERGDAVHGARRVVERGPGAHDLLLQDRVDQAAPSCELDAAGDPILQEEIVGAGAAFHYTPGTVQTSPRSRTPTILEVSTPQLDDVVRLEDAYGRPAGTVGGLSASAAAT